MRFRIGLTLVLSAISLAAACGLAAGAEAKPALPLEGKLVQVAGQPVLRVGGKDYPLSAVRTWHFNTLLDKRLEGREIRVEGEWAADGTLKVRQFYTMKDGKIYRVRYFCEVCNIEALEPGNCVCCQAPTELQEIPVSK